jgi:cell division protein FtsW (lipid II flippase)
MRHRGRSLAFVVLAVAAAGALLWIGIDAVTTPAKDCDNMAGECLRGRQTAALYLLAGGCLGLAAVALWCAFALTRRGWSRGRGAAVVISAILAALLLLVAPVGHLDNRFSGWLSSQLDTQPSAFPALALTLRLPAA